MSADTVKHLIDSNSLNLFCLGGAFNEDLRMQVVVIVGHVVPSLSQQHQNVHTLI